MSWLTNEGKGKFWLEVGRDVIKVSNKYQLQLHSARFNRPMDGSTAVIYMM